MSWDNRSYLIGANMAWIMCSLLIMLNGLITFLDFLYFNVGWLVGMDLALLIKPKIYLKNDR